MSNNPEAIETKVTIENPDVGEEADDVMEMKAISGSGLAQPPTIKVKLMTCFHEFSKYVSTKGGFKPEDTGGFLGFLGFLLLPKKIPNH